MANYYYEYGNNNSYVAQDYEPTIYNLFDYNYPTLTTTTTITTAYSTFTPTQPQTLIYHCNRQIAASPAPAESLFNAPGFDEYDTTPYGGGYDIVQTYGRPLPPSDQTCYPRGGGHSHQEREEAAPPEIKVTDTKPVESEREEIRSVEFPEEVIIRSQVPSGYGLEAMDLCGYWPAKYYADEVGDFNGGCFCCRRGFFSSYSSSAAADYLFGGPDPYVERRDGGGSFGQPIHCYHKRFQTQPLTVQLVAESDYCDYDDGDRDIGSWPHQGFTIF